MLRRALLSTLLGATSTAALAGWAANPAWGAPRRSSRGKRAAPRKTRSVPWLVGGKPNVQAPGALVLDLDSDRELYTRRADQPRPIASISKLAAALCALEQGLDLDQVTTITQTDADAARGGATSRLLVGLSLSNLDLLHAALLGSDNRAVSALGRAAGMTLGELTAAMNRKARALGLGATRFREPTGLSSENVATPRECIRMLQACLDTPRLATVLAKLDYDAHPVSRPVIHYTATYKPALRPNARIVGGKTGYNDFARYCLVLAADIDGRRFGMAFLGAEGKLTRFGDFARVADWLVAHKPHRKLAGPPADPAHIPYPWIYT